MSERESKNKEGTPSTTQPESQPCHESYYSVNAAHSELQQTSSHIPGLQVEPGENNLLALDPQAGQVT